MFQPLVCPFLSCVPHVSTVSGLSFLETPCFHCLVCPFLGTPCFKKGPFLSCVPHVETWFVHLSCVPHGPPGQLSFLVLCTPCFHCLWFVLSCLVYPMFHCLWFVLSCLVYPMFPLSLVPRLERTPCFTVSGNISWVHNVSRKVCPFLSCVPHVETWFVLSCLVYPMFQCLWFGLVYPMFPVSGPFLSCVPHVSTVSGNLGYTMTTERTNLSVYPMWNCHLVCPFLSCVPHVSTVSGLSFLVLCTPCFMSLVPFKSRKYKPCFTVSGLSFLVLVHNVSSLWTNQSLVYPMFHCLWFVLSRQERTMFPLTLVSFLVLVPTSFKKGTFLVLCTPCFHCLWSFLVLCTPCFHWGPFLSCVPHVSTVSGLSFLVLCTPCFHCLWFVLSCLVYPMFPLSLVCPFLSRKYPMFPLSLTVLSCLGYPMFQLSLDKPETVETWVLYPCFQSLDKPVYPMETPETCLSGSFLVLCTPCFH